MKLKRKPKMVTPVPPTDLKDTKFIDELKKLSDDELLQTLWSATRSESWAYSIAATSIAKDQPELVNELTLAAGHARIAREVCALLLVQREDKKNGKDPKGYL